MNEQLEKIEIIGQAYDGRLVGNAMFDYSQDSTTYDMDVDIYLLNTETFIKEVKPKDVYINGIANGRFTGKGTIGEMGTFSMKLQAEPEGGIIRISDAETFLNDLPGGNETVTALKGSLGATKWDRFIDTMKNYDYKTGGFEGRIDPEANEISLQFRFSSKNPKVGERNLDFVVHDIDKGLFPKIEY